MIQQPVSVKSIPGLIRCCRAIVALGIVMLLALPWLCLPQTSDSRRSIAKAAWTVVLFGFGVRIRVHGAPDCKTGLFAANHISWLDIAVLGKLIDAAFVAKSEVRRWPIIGPLASNYQCLFIDRQRRSTLFRPQSTTRASHPVILFPEGTTGPGWGLLPFQSSLFAIVTGDADRGVQPVAIMYRRRDFTPLTPIEMRRIAWIGDDALLPHALALAASGGVAVEVHFRQPFAAQCRKSAARQCHQAIAASLDVLPQAAATANLAA